MHAAMWQGGLVLEGIVVGVLTAWLCWRGPLSRRLPSLPPLFPGDLKFLALVALTANAAFVAALVLRILHLVKGNPAMEAKSVFASKTVWGAVVALLATLAPLVLGQIGVSDPDAQLGIWNDVVAVGGAVFSIYGRLVASKVIG